MNILEKIKKYCFAELHLTKKEEQTLLNEVSKYTKLNISKNSGKLSEWYVENTLKNLNIDFKSQEKIYYVKNNKNRYIIPDFYIPSKNLFLEVKSRTFNISGTASEKLDNCPRKYSNLQLSDYSESKILIICSAGELLQESTIELINYEKSTHYTQDFIKLCKNHNVLDFVSIKDFLKYII